MISDDVLNNRKQLLLEDIDVQQEFADLTYSVYTVEKVLEKRKDLSSEAVAKLLGLEKRCMRILLDMLDVLQEDKSNTK